MERRSIYLRLTVSADAGSLTHRHLDVSTLLVLIIHHIFNMINYVMLVSRQGEYTASVWSAGRIRIPLDP